MSVNQAHFPVALMARVLGVSKAGYYAWLRRPPSAHAVAGAALLKRIRAVHASSRETYGVPCVHAALRAGGERHSRKRVERLMRQAGLVGASHRRSGPVTTRRDGEARPAPDLVNRDFTAPGPNQLWVADITFIPTAVGFLYLAVVLDAWSRRIVGWAMTKHLRAELVLEALEMAVGQRRPKDVIHHSDQGSQYTSLTFGKRCAEAGVRPSMGSVGDAYERHGRELLQQPGGRTARAPPARRAGRGPHGALQRHPRPLHPVRPHSALGYRSPIIYEQERMQTAQAEP